LKPAPISRFRGAFPHLSCSIGSSYEIAFRDTLARNGTINIDDQKCPCIQIYKGTYHSGTVSLPGVARPVTFALNKSNKDLWVTDVASKTVDEIPYPGGDKILYQISGFYEPVGGGVIPPGKP
jgi:hypothetical protein